MGSSSNIDGSVQIIQSDGGILYEMVLAFKRFPQGRTYVDYTITESAFLFSGKILNFGDIVEKRDTPQPGLSKAKGWEGIIQKGCLRNRSTLPEEP